eukprot:5146688-Prymnesium_polylepis.2
MTVRAEKARVAAESARVAHRAEQDAKKSDAEEHVAADERAAAECPAAERVAKSAPTMKFRGSQNQSALELSLINLYEAYRQCHGA